MARSPSAIRQRDVTRALKAAKAAGLGLTHIEINPDGKIVIVTSEAIVNTSDEVLDQELAAFEEKHES